MPINNVVSRPETANKNVSIYQDPQQPKDMTVFKRDSNGNRIAVSVNKTFDDTKFNIKQQSKTRAE